LGDDVEVFALKGIDLEIKEGEFVAIIGPSGSGKSTLMHIIGILDQPTSGVVKLEGSDVELLPEQKLAELRNKHIGFVFQAFNLLPKTSAVENVELPLIYSNVSAGERRKRAIEALQTVDLGERLNHTPSQLSGGQQQRVAVARALVTNPSLILADEPTGNLDSKAGDEIIDLLKDLNKKGHTIVLVTHEREIAEQAKRIVEIKDGLIIADHKTR
jgi:putative ABC transport system ATP-binding protein